MKNILVQFTQSAQTSLRIRNYYKIGFLEFSGGYAMLSLIYEEASKLYMTVNQFADLNSIASLFPDMCSTGSRWLPKAT